MKLCSAKNSSKVSKEIMVASDLKYDGRDLSIKPFTKKPFLSAAICAFALFLVLNAIPLSMRINTSTNIISNDSPIRLSKLRQLVMNSPYEATQSGPWPWWVARAYFTTPSPDIVVMGDSQINAAFIQADAMTKNKHMDCTVDRSCISLKEGLHKYGFMMHSKSAQVVNLAIGGAMPSDYYLMSKSFFSKESHPELVIVSLSPRSFLDATLTCASATETFQFLAPMIDLGGLVDSAFTNPFEKCFWLIRNKFTLFVYQQDINLVIHNFLTQHLLFAKSMNPYERSNDPVASRQPLSSIYSGNGFVAIGSNVVGPNPTIPFRENKAEYMRRFAQLNSRTLKDQYNYFQATLEYLHSLGVQVIVIDMPMLQPVRELLPATFWHTYHSLLQNACVKNSACLLDLSKSKNFPQDEYIDYVHLNATGGKHFTDLLASYIKSNYHSH